MSISSASTRPRQYSNYTNPFDLQVFNQVMQTKQAKFDQGAAALQSRVDSFASLDVIADSDREYLNSKVNETINGINKLGGQDLSDSSVLTQLSGYVSGIGKDERILQAVTDTKKIRNLQSSYSEIKKNAAAGKKGAFYNPANEDYDMSNVTKYLEAKKADPTARYNGSSQATPYHDYTKEQREITKNIKASTIVKTQLSPDGYQYITTKSERVTPMQVQEAVMGQMSDAARRQMHIDAQYKYKNVPDEALVNEYVGLAQREKAVIESQLANSDLLAKIDPTNKVKESLIKQRDELTSLIEKKRKDMNNFLVSDRASAIDQLYTGKVSAALAEAAAYNKEDVKIQSNTGRIHQETLALRQNIANQSASLKGRDQEIKLNELKYRIGRDAIDQNNIDRKYNLELAKAQFDALEKGYAFTLDGGKIDLMPTTQGQQYVGNSFANEAKSNALDVLRSANTDLEIQKRDLANKYYAEYAKTYDHDGTLFTVSPDGKHYVPTEKFKQGQAEIYKAVNDMSNGRKPNLSGLDPVSANFYKQYQEFEIKQKANQNLVNRIENTAIEATRAEAKSKLGLTDAQYNSYIKGKQLYDSLPTVEGGISVMDESGFIGSTSIGSKKDYSKLTEANKKEYQVYEQYKSKLDPIYNKQIEAQQAQYSQRLNPVGSILTPANAKKYTSAMLSQKSGYYKTDANNAIVGRPENVTSVLSEKNTSAPRGVIVRNIDGKGARPYFEATMTEDDQTYNILVPMDEESQRQFPGLGSEYSITEAVKNAPRNTIEFKSLGNVSGSKVVNAFDVQVVEIDEGQYALKVKQPFDVDGRPLSSPVWVMQKEKFPSAEMAKKAGDEIGPRYTRLYEQTKQVYGKKLTPREFIYSLEK